AAAGGGGGVPESGVPAAVRPRKLSMVSLMWKGTTPLNGKIQRMCVIFAGLGVVRPLGWPLPPVIWLHVFDTVTSAGPGVSGMVALGVAQLPSYWLPVVGTHWPKLAMKF